MNYHAFYDSKSEVWSFVFWRQFRSHKALFVTRNHLRFKYNLISCHIGPIYQPCHCPRCQKLLIFVQEGALQHFVCFSGDVLLWRTWVVYHVTKLTSKKKFLGAKLGEGTFLKEAKALNHCARSNITQYQKKLRTKVSLYSLWDIFFRFLILSNKNLER